MAVKSPALLRLPSASGLVTNNGTASSYATARFAPKNVISLTTASTPTYIFFISPLERGENNVTSCMLYQISKAFKIELKELFDFKIPEKENKFN